MTKQEKWQLTKTKERKNIIRELSKKLRTSNFARVIDISLRTTLEDTENTDNDRRFIQAKLTKRGFLPEDFTWRDK